MFWEVIFVFIVSLTPLRWLGHNEVILGNDSGARLDGIQHLSNLWHTWNPTLSFGYDWALNKGLLLAKLPETIFQTLTGSLHEGQQLSMIFWFFVIGLGMYIGIRMLYPDKKFWVLRLWTAVLWMYNFYILHGWINIDRSKFSLFAALPIIFAILVKTAKGDLSPIHAGVISGIVMFFLHGGGGVHLYGGFFVTLLTTSIYFWISARAKRKAIVGYVVVFGVTTFLTCAWWLWPLIYRAFTTYGSALAAYGGTQGILDWEAQISRHTSFINLLRLQGIPGWYDGNVAFARAFISNPFFIVTSFVPILLAGLTILRARFLPKEYLPSFVVFPLAILLPIGLIFSAGSHPPLGFIYTFLIEHVPGFAIFRSSFFKFAPALWFPVIVLSGLAIQRLVEQIHTKRVRILIGAISLVAILAYHWPFFTSDFFAFSPPFSTKIIPPSYVTHMIDSFEQMPKDSRILLVPPIDNQFLANSYTWGYWSQALLPSFGAPVSIVTNEKNAPPHILDIYEAVGLGDVSRITKLLTFSGIEHILWQADVRFVDGKTSADFASYHKAITSIPGITKSAEFGEWILYTLPGDAIAPLVTAHTMTTNFVSPQESIADILELTDRIDTVITTQRTPLPVSKDIFKATCAGCDLASRDMYKNLNLPSIRIRPDSPLYPYLVITLENRHAFAQRLNRAAMVDMHLGLIGKRLAELSALSATAHAGTNAITQTISRLHDHVEAIADLIKELSGETQVYYANRAKEFLYFYERQFTNMTVPEDQRLRIQKDFAQTNEILTPLVIWSDEQTLRYYVDLPQGQYHTMVYPPPMRNGKKTPNLSDIATPENGIQQFEIPMPDGDLFTNPPRLYAIHDRETNTLPAPEIGHERMSPTRIEGKVEGSENPYIITFGDRYHTDWKLEVTPPVSTQHIKVNGYMNGWILPPGPTRTFRILYWPQQIFIIGVMVSMSSLIITAIYLVRKSTS